MFNFENLRVYKDSLEYIDHVYKITKTWSSNERFGLTDQLRRASSSVALNIAEGTSRTKKDFGHFLDLARGSCYECVSVLQIALGQKYISQQDYSSLYDELEMISRKLSALKRSLQ